MITVELIGSYIAVHHESGIAADLTSKRHRSTTKSAIPVLARKLLAAGYDPQDRLHVLRKSLAEDRFIPVFKRDRKLLIWAGVDVIEDVARGPREVKHRPYTGPATVVAQNARGAAGASAGAAAAMTRENAAHGNTLSAPQFAGEVC